METQVARRAARDVLAVCQCARPVAAARWMAALAIRLPECVRCGSLRPADRTWARSGARFRTSTGATVSLPGRYSAGAREMYCRNVYLRSGLVMPSRGWVLDLGANRGLFSVWAARTGARAVAVEAQHGFASEIRRLARHNRVLDRIRIETAIVGGVSIPGASVGVLADDHRWSTTSHGAPTRPPGTSVPELMSAHEIRHISLLKLDIEGGEFAVLGADEDLGWLKDVDQVVLEVHRDFGDPVAIIDRLRDSGFAIDLRDNDGLPVAASSDRLDYAYCQR
jgi:FkbM family methyltransferase